MPIFEYQCSGCGRTFEFLSKNSSDAPASCPHCGSSDFKKQFSAFAVKIGGSQSSSPKMCHNCPAGPCMRDD